MINSDISGFLYGFICLLESLIYLIVRLLRLQTLDKLAKERNRQVTAHIELRILPGIEPDCKHLVSKRLLDHIHHTGLSAAPVSLYGNSHRGNTCCYKICQPVHILGDIKQIPANSLYRAVIAPNLNIICAHCLPPSFYL